VAGLCARARDQRHGVQVAGPRLTNRRRSAAANESGARGTSAHGGRRVCVLLPRNHAPAKPGPGRSWRHRSVARPVARSRPRALRRRHPRATIPFRAARERPCRYVPVRPLVPLHRSFHPCRAGAVHVHRAVERRGGVCARRHLGVYISSCEQGTRRRAVEAHASVQALGVWSSY
jgi:hypothetical protein